MKCVVRILCCLAFASPLAAALAQEEGQTPAEKEWSDLQVDLTPKMLRYREMTPEQRAEVSFRGELARIGNFVRKYSRTEPGYAMAARIFMARSLLSDTLGKHKEALQALQSVVVEAPQAESAGMAALYAADIVVTNGGDEGSVRALRELYEGREDADPQFVQMLRSAEVKASIRPDRPFPDVPLTLLDGSRRSLSSYRGKWVYLLYFNVVHGPSFARLQEALAVARSTRDLPVQVVLVSLDLQRAKLEEKLGDLEGLPPVSFEGKEQSPGTGRAWDSRSAVAVALGTLPADYLIDPEGVLVMRGLASGQVDALIRLEIEEGAPRDGDDGGGR